MFSIISPCDYKVEQTLTKRYSFDALQSRASVITKWGSFFALKCGTSEISKKGSYKVGQFLLQSEAGITKRGNSLQSEAIVTK